VRDHFLMSRLELLWAAACLYQGDTVAYQLRRKELLTREASQPENEQLALRRELAMFEGQVLEQSHELAKTYEELIVTNRCPLAKVQQDEYNVTLALTAVQLGRIEEAQQLVEQVRTHALENEKWWVMGILLRVDGWIAAQQSDFERMNRAFAESAIFLNRVKASYDCYLTYRAWWSALRNHRLEKTPEAVKVKSSLGEFPMWRASRGPS